MKKFILACASIAISVLAVAQDNAAVKPKAEEVVKFKEYRHDFGKIKQGTPVTYDFAFENISGKPVVIESATASCGCTTPVKPEQPIAKGKTNTIKAGFNAQAVGPFDKTIFVKVQGVDTPVELKIAGEVLTEVDFAKYESEKKSKPKAAGSH